MKKAVILTYMENDALFSKNVFTNIILKVNVILTLTFRNYRRHNILGIFETLPYCQPAGAASIGKGLGGILFSRFSRSNSQPSVSLGVEGGANAEEEEEKRTESQSSYGLSTITRPTSPTGDALCMFFLVQGINQSVCLFLYISDVR